MPVILEKKLVEVEIECVSVVCDKCGETRSTFKKKEFSEEYYPAPTGWTKCGVYIERPHINPYVKTFFFCPEHDGGQLLVPA